MSAAEFFRDLDASRALYLEAPAAPQPAKVAQGWTGSCKAVDAATGRRCRLPAHPEPTHRHERGAFFRVASASQTTFPLREQLDRAALAQGAAAIETGRAPAKPVTTPTTKPRRTSAHRGDATTTGEEP